MLCVGDIYQMDKNKTQTLLPCECELDILHLDISTHGEAASVRAVTNALACLVGFLSADMISSYNWLTHCTSHKKRRWIISFEGRLALFGECIFTTG